MTATIGFGLGFVEKSSRGWRWRIRYSKSTGTGRETQWAWRQRFSLRKQAKSSEIGRETQ